MAKLQLADTRRKALKLVGIQALAVVLVSVVFLFFQGVRAGLSVLMGGVCWLIPCLVYAFCLFADVSARSTNRIITVFYVGELLKLGLSSMFFVMVISYLPVITGPSLIGFIVALISVWLAPLAFSNKRAAVS